MVEGGINNNEALWWLPTFHLAKKKGVWKREVLRLW
jgi:hypothetical protein